MLDALLTTMHCASHDGTTALIRSFGDHHPGVPVFVLETEQSDADGRGIHRINVGDIARDQGIPIMEIFDDEDALAFSLPFSLARILQEVRSVVLIQPGCLVVGALTEVSDLLDRDAFVVAGSRLMRDATAGTPTLTMVAEPRRLMSHRLVGLREDGARYLDFWSAAMREAIVDPFMRRPLDVYPGVLEALYTEHGGGLASDRTIADLTEFTAVEMGLATNPQAAVVEVDELWVIARAAAEDDKDETDIARMLGEVYLSGKIHDSGPILPLIDQVRSAVAAAPPRTTPQFQQFSRKVRHAADPMGIRWKLGEHDRFEDWMFERNGVGLTRAAHIFWYQRQDLQDAFPDVHLNSERYEEWFADRGITEFGIDLFNRETLAGEIDDPQPVSEWIIKTRRFRDPGERIFLEMADSEGPDPAPSSVCGATAASPAGETARHRTKSKGAATGSYSMGR